MNDISEKKIVNRITSRIKERSPMRISLPKSGLLKIDQPVPFLLVYRFPPDGKDYFTYQLGKTESSYIMAHDDPESFLQPILRTLIKQLSDMFGAFLLLEVWVADREKPKTHDFIIYLNHKSAEPIAEILRQELSITIGRTQIETIVERAEAIAPPYYTTLLSRDEAKKSGSLLIGLEIQPVYINTATGRPYPLFLRELRNTFGKALKKAFFEFVRLHTSFNASHFQMLGTTVIEDLVWQIDESLEKLSNQFDFLFLITPVNLEDAWNTFAKSNFQKQPIFHYRHMPIDPELIKRKLYDLPIEEITDPTIAFLFRDKRKEVDRMLTMMIDREKSDFVQSSIQVFGRVDDNLLDIARGLLVAIPLSAAQPEREKMKTDEFVSLALQELGYLKEQYPDVNTEIRVRDDVEGVLVSRGILHINKKFTIERSRASALIQHEIGTHVVTYYNGKAQPLRLFYCGVPGYEQLQEGLAVLAEYIMGGLTNGRLRTLAARVVVVNHMVAGHSFIDTFYMLVDKYSFSEEGAFSITMRVYRGGGLTKDAVYLRGLLNLLEYIKEGKDLLTLLVGKIRQDYLPIIEELTYRKLLKPVPIRPRYLGPDYRERLKTLEKGITVFNLIR